MQQFDWFSTPSTVAEAIKIYEAFERLQQSEYIGEI